MRILTISDYVVKELYDYFDPALFGNVDVILSCGDLPPEYLEFLRSKLDAHLFYILGNHDIRYMENPPLGCTDISGRLIKEQGLRIMGLPGSRWYNGGPNQYTEKQMRGILRRLTFTLYRNKGVDIVISHAPPRNNGDREDPCHKGFKSFLPLIAKHQPLWFIHGHIHTLFTSDHGRISHQGNTHILNCYGYYVLDLKSR